MDNELLLEVHRLSKKDETPLQLISVDLLAHYRLCEQVLLKRLKRDEAERAARRAARREIED